MPAAVRYYKEALALEPTHTFAWYSINNNLGFSLNTLGQFAEGENYCRRPSQFTQPVATRIKISGLHWRARASIGRPPDASLPRSVKPVESTQGG